MRSSSRMWRGPRAVVLQQALCASVKAQHPREGISCCPSVAGQGAVASKTSTTAKGAAHKIPMTANVIHR